MDRLLIRPEEAARLLAVGRTRLYAMLQSGELPSITIGRSRRILRADLEGWVANLAETGSAGAGDCQPDCQTARRRPVSAGRA